MIRIRSTKAQKPPESNEDVSFIPSLSSKTMQPLPSGIFPAMHRDRFMHALKDAHTKSSPHTLGASGLPRSLTHCTNCLTLVSNTLSGNFVDSVSPLDQKG
eukprot:GFKZ01001706.1.p1 GENE.GFKZ01001706.1~~GFKZ01001706.1.p1  ORF type:complete len:101 (+),score=6.86 GFKZ01001706.1:183-485(+)